MPTQEDRIAALEQKVFSMELEHLYEKRQAEENTPTEQASNLKEINHHLTILIGIASGQERDIKIVKSDVSSIKEHVDGFEQRFNSVDRRLDGFEQRFNSVDRRLDGFEQRFDSVDRRLDAQERDIKIVKSDVSSIKEHVDGFEQRFTSVEGKLEQIVQILTAPPKTGE